MLITYNYSIHAVYRPTNITFVSHGFWDGVHWLKGRGWSRTSSWVTCPFSMRCPILGKILYLNAYDCGFYWCLCWKKHHLNCHWFTVLVDGIPDDWSTFRFCQPRQNVGPKFHQPIPFSNPHAGEIYHFPMVFLHMFVPMSISSGHQMSSRSKVTMPRKRNWTEPWTPSWPRARRFFSRRFAWIRLFVGGKLHRNSVFWQTINKWPDWWWLEPWNLDGLSRFHILGIIIPTDSYSSEGLKPPTRWPSTPLKKC
jgi:hypothetical protein